MRTPWVVALATVAVLVVLGAAVVAGVAARGGGETSADDATSSDGAGERDEPTDEEGDESDVQSFFPDGQVLTGDRRDNANVEVPSTEDGWEKTVSSYVISYVDDEGLPAVGVTGPAVWRSGPCGDEEEDARAWTGFTAPTTDEGQADAAQASVELVSGTWEETLRADPDVTEVGEVETSSTTVSDGSDAATARFVFTTAGEGADCYPPAYELRFLSVDTGDYVANLVLQRGVRRDGSDAPGHLDAETADVILASARKQQAG